jgi:hypothetical protein
VERNETPIKLSYSSPRTPRSRLTFKWLSRLPHWLIALALLAPLLICNWFHIERVFRWESSDFENPYMFLKLAALFLAGSVRRLNWRHFLVMLSLAVFWCVLDAGLKRGPSVPFPYDLTLWVAPPVLIVALGEWALVRPHHWRSALWAIGLSAAVGCLVPLIVQPLDFTGVTVPVRSIGGWTQKWPLGGILYWPLLTVMTWIAAPLALKLGPSVRRRQQLVAAGIVLASVASFLLFFRAAVFPIARGSLAGKGIFSRAWSVTILNTRGSPSDQQAMWDALEAADWSSRQDGNLYDYRTACISVLAERGPHATAVRLSKLLLEKPSSELAEFSAPLLAADHRYETAPLLMRYALLEHSRCTTALETMRIPNAALAIIRTAAIYGELTSSGSNFPISQRERQRLTALLGKDAGPNFHDWTLFYDQTADQRPTPLSKQDVLAMNRVIDAIESYWVSTERLYEAKCRLFIRRMKDQDDGRLTRAIATLESVQQRRHYLTVVDIDRLDANSSYLVHDFFQRATADMAVAPPNWSARGTADLEREVKGYGSRVDAMIAQYDGPNASTQPATTLP